MVLGHINIDSVLYSITSRTEDFVGTKSFGYIDHKRRTICINPNLDDVKIIKILLHEIIHEWNLWRLDQCLSEAHCSQLASAIFSLLYQNPFLLVEFDNLRKNDDKIIENFERKETEEKL